MYMIIKQAVKLAIINIVMQYRYSNYITIDYKNTNLVCGIRENFRVVFSSSSEAWIYQVDCYIMCVRSSEVSLEYPYSTYREEDLYSYEGTEI